jgi:hypothetical protein
MSRQQGRHQRTSRQLWVTLTVVLTAFLVASPGAARTSARSNPAGATDAKAWCAYVIQVNTRLGTMKNKRFLPTASVTPSMWKKVVDAAVAGRSKFLAVTPSSIKTAATHEMAYFAHLKANHYSRTTPLAPWTVAEVTQITNFEKTKCGIKFG